MSPIMRVLIVDDEPPARARLRRLVDELEGAEVAGEADNGRRALELVETCEPDLLLLDIRMPGMDGLEVARHLALLPEPPAVVFTTAFDRHALEAFEACAVDYLLKPIRRERLAAALDRARTLTRAQLALLAGSADSEASRARTHVSATLHGNLQIVPVTDVRYFRADQKYVTARHTGGELLMDESLTALEKEFAESFTRVHRNALVATRHVRGLEREASGRFTLSFDGMDDTVEVSRRLASKVRRLLR